MVEVINRTVEGAMSDKMMSSVTTCAKNIHRRQEETHYGRSAVLPSLIMAAFWPQLAWKSSLSLPSVSGVTERDGLGLPTSGDRALMMALLRLRRSLWLWLWTMVTLTAMPYRSTTP